MEERECIQLIIREATEVDYPALRRILFETRLHSFTWEQIQRIRLEDFDYYTKDENILVAEKNATIMGFVSLNMAHSFIHNLFVHPEFSGQGVGVQLVRVATAKMAKPVRLKCVSENHRALKFYEANGWRKAIEVGVAPEKYWVMEYR